MPLPLVERSQKEIVQLLRSKIEEVPAVRGVHNIEVRMTGKRLDITAHVLLDSTLGFEDVHRIVFEIEREIRKSVQRSARITVQTEPAGHTHHKMAARVAQIAEKIAGSRGVHNVHLQKIAGKWAVDLRVEVSANITVKQAHNVSTQIEHELRNAIPDLGEITIHLESASDLIASELEGRGSELKWIVVHAAKRFPEIKAVHALHIRKTGENYSLALKCKFDSAMNIKLAHEISLKFATAIKNAYPNVDRIDIQEEPA